MKEVVISDFAVVWGNDIVETTTEYSVAEIKASGHNRFEGWMCTVGQNCVYIDFDGMVWCGPCRVGGPLGHMLTDWQLPKEMLTCTNKTCDCGTGIKLHKHSYPARLDALEPQLFNVQWDLGRRCNYDCSYCWPTSHNKTDQWVPVEVLKKVVDNIERQYHGLMQFNFAGGEPTLHPDFIELCEYIAVDGHVIHVQTNGTMNVKRARELSLVAEISISVHFEFAKFDKLINNIEAILENPLSQLEIKMMIAPTPESFEKQLDFECRLGEVIGIEAARVIRSPLRDPVSNDLMGYAPEQLKDFGDVEF